jgi:hypothetical protein
MLRATVFSMLTRISLSLFVLVALGACGGGSPGGGGGVVTVAPTISTQPVATSVVDGANASFSVVAAGDTPLAYQWRRNGVDLVSSAGVTGATTSALTLTAPYSFNASQISVRVTNGVGSVISGNALLTVTPTAPTITSQPTSLSITAGASATFSIAISGGTAPVAYQWKRSGAPIVGATSATYAIPATVIGDNAATFAVDIVNPAGTVSSAAATLTVTAPQTAGVGPCFGAGANGGWCWQNRNPVSITLYGGAAANPTTAWAIGELGVVIKTTDGGTTWQRVRRYDTAGGFYKSMSAADANTVWAVGASSQIIKTIDGGATWTTQNSGSTDILNDVVANSASVAWTVGVNGVLRTSDGGATWQKLTTLAGPLYRLSAPTASIAYVTVQPDSVAKTTDGGATWSTTQLLGLSGSLATAVSAPSATVAWVVGQNGLVMR